MRRNDVFFGGAMFVALALAMPLAALEPIEAGTQSQPVKIAAGACGAKLAPICAHSAA